MRLLPPRLVNRALCAGCCYSTRNRETDVTDDWLERDGDEDEEDGESAVPIDGIPLLMVFLRHGEANR